MALCESLNFTRAAEYCNVTQPSLTRAIKVLENEVGGQLFHRERGNIHLTELGALLRPHLEEVMAQSRTAQAKAAGMLSLGKARLKLGLRSGFQNVLRRLARMKTQAAVSRARMMRPSRS
jgi:LysR family transcriptional regulator, hydrogen peroxide-inducible genes activator